jgi:PAS domain S-box-containing protein
MTALQQRTEGPVAVAVQMQDLVNRLTQELAQMQRSMASSHARLLNTTRSLEVRTQDLAEARAALALLRATLDASQDGVMAIGHFGRAMHFNSRFCEIWGIGPDKAAELNDAALLALQLTQVKDPARFLDFVQSARARPDEERCEIVEMGDGRILECRVMPQRVRERRVGSVTCVRDVTERKRLEDIVAQLESLRPASLRPVPG